MFFSQFPVPLQNYFSLDSLMYHQDTKIILAVQEKWKIKKVKSVALPKKHVLSEYPRMHKEGRIKTMFNAA